MIRARPLALAFVFVPVFASAQQSDADSDAQADAQTLATRIAEAMAASGCGAALPLMDELQTLLPERHDLRYNRARCHRDLGEPLEALELAEAIVESGEGEPAERARRLIEEESVKVATIASEVPGAILTVEGRSCTSPCRLRVNPGTHFARLARDGEEHESSIRVQSGQNAHALWPAQPEAGETEVAPVEEEDTGYSPGALTGVGLGLAVVGGAGIVGFGLAANSAEDTFDRAMPPSQGQYDRAVRLQRAANASIAVASLGAALFVLELILDAR
ncbi:MAG: hypothetical protein AAGE52_34455 [Myxococcota bacterium]